MSLNIAEDSADNQRSLFWQVLLLAAGPSLALVTFWASPETYLSPQGELVELGFVGRTTLAMMVWMSAWWLTEATDITVTALLPIALFPIVGISSIDSASAPYADKVVFLFMGGFILALSMQRWGLGKRIALWTLLMVGTRPANIVGGFMLITAVFSAFVSNVATVAMMLPIALSVIGVLEQAEQNETNPGRAGGKSAFATCLLLGIAYAASIGGISTIIGTAPNVFLVSFLADGVGEADRLEISFVGWMAVGTPLAAVILILTWGLLTQVLFRLPSGGSAQGQWLIKTMIRQLGPVKRGESVTAVIFALTVAAWITRPWLNNIEIGSGDTRWQPLGQLSDTGIVMISALTLFFFPASSRRENLGFVMDWQTAKELPWNVLILFGGGLSLAAAVKTNGVAEFLGSQLNFLADQPDWLVVLVVTTVVVFITELTSNTATTASLLPVLAALAPVVGMHPAMLAIATAISASCAFMLPVATPPNAIVYGCGQITIRQMARAGFWVNLISIACISLTVLYLVPLVFKIE